MGFWIFMLVMNLLIPITMIGFGSLFMRKAPAEINAVFGYRTGMSMKNKDTWDFAHKYCGKIWFSIGWVLLIMSVVVMVLLLGQDKDTLGGYGALLCTIQLIPLIGAILPTELALRKSFDKDGNRKE